MNDRLTLSFDDHKPRWLAALDQHQYSIADVHVVHRCSEVVDAGHGFRSNFGDNHAFVQCCSISRAARSDPRYDNSSVVLHSKFLGNVCRQVWQLQAEASSDALMKTFESVSFLTAKFEKTNIINYFLKKITSFCKNYCYKARNYSWQNKFKVIRKKCNILQQKLLLLPLLQYFVIKQTRTPIFKVILVYLFKAKFFHVNLRVDPFVPW